MHTADPISVCGRVKRHRAPGVSAAGEPGWGVCCLSMVACGAGARCEGGIACAPAPPAAAAHSVGAPEAHGGASCRSSERDQRECAGARLATSGRWRRCAEVDAERRSTASRRAGTHATIIAGEREREGEMERGEKARGGSYGGTKSLDVHSSLDSTLSDCMYVWSFFFCFFFYYYFYLNACPLGLPVCPVSAVRPPFNLNRKSYSLSLICPYGLFSNFKKFRLAPPAVVTAFVSRLIGPFFFWCHCRLTEHPICSWLCA